MATEYTDATEVDLIVKALVPTTHPHLADERIRCVFRDEHAKEGGKAIWGRARKISGLNAYLSGSAGAKGDDYFVIEIAQDIWAGLNRKECLALVDHELSHCGIKTNPKTFEQTLCLLPHDVEEFQAVLERHGLWRRDVKDFIAAGAGQLRLVEDEAAVSAVVGADVR